MSRRRAIAFAGLWLGVSGAAFAAQACYGRNCEGSGVTFGADTAQGQMINDTTWESSAPGAKWLPFPRQRYYVFDIRALGGRIPSEQTAYVSAQEQPSTGGNFTNGSGNIALFANPLPNRIDVINDTCSDYFLRLVVKVPPTPPPAPTSTADAAAPIGPIVGPSAVNSGDGGADAAPP